MSFTTIAIPESNSMQAANLLAAASEVVSGAIEEGLKLGQKVVTVSIEAAAKVFDFFSEIFSNAGDYSKNIFDSLGDGNFIMELVLFFCDLSEIWSSFSEQRDESKYSWDSLRAAFEISSLSRSREYAVLEMLLSK